jgi:hypothetical protein
MTDFLGALTGMEVTIKADKHTLTRLDITQRAETGAVQRHRFGSKHVLGLAIALGAADHQRTNAVGVTERHQTITGDQRHHGISTAHAAMYRLDGTKDGIHAQLKTHHTHGQFMGKHVQQDFRVGIGVDVPQVVTEHVRLEFVGIGQVAVMRQHDAERRVDIERLRLGQTGSRTGSRVTHMCDTGIAHQRAHVAGAEHIAHHAAALVHVKGLATGGDNTRRILPTVLQHLQSVIQQLIDGRLPYHA